MFDCNPFKHVIGRRVVVSARNHVWRGTLTAYRDEWITLTDAEYVDAHSTRSVDGTLMLPEDHIDYLQVGGETRA